MGVLFLRAPLEFQEQKMIKAHLLPVPKLRCWVLFALLVGLIAPLAQADTVYTYTGNPFDNFGPSNSGAIPTCPPICSISGFMVLASPIDFTDFQLVQVLSFSFTDQNTVLTSSNADGFISVAGDGFGNISQWVLDIGEGTGPVQLETINFEGGSTDSSGAPSQGFVFVAGKPGVWTSSTVETPEPSVLTLQILGLILSCLCLRTVGRVGKTLAL
jgi:hypothetical protein